jgi:uncharacterized protein
MNKRFISLCFAVLLCGCLICPVFAEADALIYDEADILTNREEKDLNEKLAEISDEYDTDVLVITLQTTDGEPTGDCAEELYRVCEFGRDAGGIVLLVSMENPREFDIVSMGEASNALQTSELDAVLDAIEPDMRDGEYMAAFETYAEECRYYLDGYVNGFPFDVGATLIFALIVGLVIGLIVVFIWKGQLKSVRKQNTANVYVRSGSMQVTVHSDLYLYRNVVRTRRQTSSSSGSGSGGVSRSSGGRSF